MNTAATKATRNAAVAGKPAAPVAAQSADKIMVSGLPDDVNESQIRVCTICRSCFLIVADSKLQELFTTTVGPLKNIQLHYNAGGRWNGSATVLFSRKGDGAKAYEAYNNRLVDGS